MQQYDGDAAAVWTGADTGKELVARLAKLPGFGGYKAQIFAAMLGKQFGVRPDGWREAAGHFGEEGSHYSVADIVDDASLAAVRAYKKDMKAAAKAAARLMTAPGLPADRLRHRHVLHAGYAREEADGEHVGSTVTLIQDGNVAVVVDPGMVASRRGFAGRAGRTRRAARVRHRRGVQPPPSRPHGERGAVPGGQDPRPLGHLRR